MRYFEKVFDGQVLKWCVNGAELGGGKPTLLCLVSNETEAESCLSKLEPHCGEAQVTALILPGGILPETAVQSLVFEWQTTGIIDKCKLSLTASQSCGGRGVAADFAFVALLQRGGDSRRARRPL